MNRYLYTFLYHAVHAVLRIWHPVFRVEGRENIPTEGNYLICANHSGLADPIWLLFALKCDQKCPRIMAKESVLRIPILGKILKKVGVFGVKRGENDINAVKEGLQTLKTGKNLLLFPEGTRVRPNKPAEAKSGAILLAMRTNTPILPIFLQAERRPFSPLRCVIGKPYLPQAENLRRPTPEELHHGSKELMKKIYALGESK